MVEVRLENLTKIFDKKVVAVDNIDLQIKDKEFLVLLGPSGCGKTTTIRCIAGLEKPDSGNIYIGDRLVNDVPEKDRDVAMVFQTFALWPHMKARDNIAFPLKMHKVPKKEIKKEVQKIAELLKISHLLDRMPGQLSGGEAQRVALGRAIIRDPKVFLLDEPLANLDAKLRIHMRVELKKLQEQIGVTTICVTHDQAEAMAMADTIAVMHQGKIRQMGTASELYDQPTDLFVAGFIGSPAMNFMDCTFEEAKGFLVSDAFALEIPKQLIKDIKKNATSSELILGVRPQDITVNEKEVPNSIVSEVYAVEPLGHETIFDLKLGDKIIKACTHPTYTINLGQKVWMKFDMDRMHLIDKKTEKAVI
jgi:multiple sugar transport system ATP-binding protein